MYRQAIMIWFALMAALFVTLYIYWLGRRHGYAKSVEHRRAFHDVSTNDWGQVTWLYRSSGVMIKSVHGVPHVFIFDPMGGVVALEYTSADQLQFWLAANMGRLKPVEEGR